MKVIGLTVGGQRIANRRVAVGYIEVSASKACGNRVDYSNGLFRGVGVQMHCIMRIDIELACASCRRWQLIELLNELTWHQGCAVCDRKPIGLKKRALGKYPKIQWKY